ncbi:MAG: 8-amino-7-oxononanoate synthase [Pseudomonadota bacterium]
MPDRESLFVKFIETRLEQTLFRSLIPVEHSAGPELQIQGKAYINFSGNDYLGLSQSPKLLEQAFLYATEHGVGAGASRLVTGNLTCFDKIEQKIAKLKNKPAALLMASGFQVNAGVLHALFDKSVHGVAPLVYADRLNHASMHFGCAAAQVRQIRYRHLDIDHLAELLEKNKETEIPRFILTETVFSMDGDIAPMDDICTLAEKYNCLVICDDAHATGILGDGGSGLSGDADIVIGTCSKALGSFGAFVACSKTIQHYLINRCAGFIYSTALSPVVLGAIDAALEILPDLDEARAHVVNIASTFCEKAQQKGYDTGKSQSQIVPVIIGDADKALLLSQKMKDNGFWVSAIRPPTVPKGTARLRFTFCAYHTKDHVDDVVGVL